MFHLVVYLRHIRLALLLCAVTIQFSRTKTTVVAVADTDPYIVHSWVEDCTSSGFDPFHLACSTCTVLPESFHRKCLDCCQSYIDAERITKPFQSAVLIQMTKDVPTEGEIGNFFKDDWDQVLESKGTGRLTKLVDTSASSKSSSTSRGGVTSMQDFMLYFHGGSRRTAEILFLDEPLPSSGSNEFSYTKLAAKAKETVQLDGMKREDIKDMIMTLLP